MAKESVKQISGSQNEQGSLVSSEDLQQCQECENCKFRCVEGCC